jgi:hypothetical protein
MAQIRGPGETLVSAQYASNVPGPDRRGSLPQAAVHDRNQGKFPPGSIYTNQDFNAAIRAYFRRLARTENPARGVA